MLPGGWRLFMTTEKSITHRPERWVKNLVFNFCIKICKISHFQKCWYHFAGHPCSQSEALWHEEEPGVHQAVPGGDLLFFHGLFAGHGSGGCNRILLQNDPSQRTEEKSRANSINQYIHVHRLPLLQGEIFLTISCLTCLIEKLPEASIPSS